MSLVKPLCRSKVYLQACPLMYEEKWVNQNQTVSHVKPGPLPTQQRINGDLLRYLRYESMHKAKLRMGLDCASCRWRDSNGFAFYRGVSKLVTIVIIPLITFDSVYTACSGLLH
jgi:hypothetical protein